MFATVEKIPPQQQLAGVRPAFGPIENSGSLQDGTTYQSCQ